MVCEKCADAAARLAPPGEHCGNPGRCDCQHRPVAGTEALVHRMQDAVLLADPDLQEGSAQMRRGVGVPVPTLAEGTPLRNDGV